MKKTSLFIADSDEAYLSAVTNYLLRSQKNLSVSACSDISHLKDPQSFDILLTSLDMADDVLSVVSAKRTVYLLSSGDIPPEGAEVVYRFQPMDIFVEKLLRLEASKEQTGGPRMLGVVSPIHHELSLPFALALAKICSEEERTLFIDLTEASIMPELFSGSASFDDREDMDVEEDEPLQPYDNGPDLLDVIYDIESTGAKRLPDRFVKKCDGFSYLPSACDPELLSEVTRQQWHHFMDACCHSGFDCVVILSDRLPGHFVEWKGRKGEIILLSKDGDYYRKSERRYSDYLSEKLPDVSRKIISLPMSAANLSDGTWYLESLIEGNLGKFVREKVANAG